MSPGLLGLPSFLNLDCYTLYAVALCGRFCLNSFFFLAKLVSRMCFSWLVSIANMFLPTEEKPLMNDVSGLLLASPIPELRVADADAASYAIVFVKFNYFKFKF